MGSPYSEEQLESILLAHRDAPLFAALRDAAPAALAQTPRGKALLDWAKSAPTPIPPLPYSLYRVFRRTGERDSFQKPYFERRTQLTQAVFAAWFEPNVPEHIDRVSDLVWAICEETTWVLPAHEGPEWNVDLFNAETAAHLSDVVLILGDQLPEEIRERIRREVDRRVLTNYLEHLDNDIHWWRRGMNNWTGVCSGSIGQAALVLEQDLDRQAKILSLVIGDLTRYIENGFAADGGCLEGRSYWAYGLTHVVSFSEKLRDRTGGEIDLLAHPKMKLIAQYPLVVSAGNGLFASFADSAEAGTLPGHIASALAQRCGAPELLSLAGDSPTFRLDQRMRTFLCWDGVIPERAQQADIVLPVSGIGRMASTQPNGLLLVAKAGHNDEPHNHNDVGSFVVSAEGTIYLCDPGSGVYNLAYFDKRRYESIFTRSMGHSVPRFEGKEQQPGAQYRGEMTQPAPKTLEVRFEKAYPVDTLESLKRVFSMNNDGTLTLVDSFAFRSDGLEVEEGFMTWQKVKVKGDTARIESKSGTLLLRAESGGTFEVETFDITRHNEPKPKVLRRIRLNLPAKSEGEARFKMSYSPKRSTKGIRE